METHSSTLAWKIPWTEEPIGLQSMGLKESDTTKQLSSIQSLSRVQLSATPWTAAHQTSLFITSSLGLLKLMSNKSVMPSNYSSYVIPFSSCLQSFPESGSFPMSHSFASGDQSIGASASASVLPMNIQG